jgi:ankyrin repeat protein
MLAERRLKLNEVVTAFAVEDGEELQPDNMPSADILHQVCAGLVVLNEDDNTVGLVHGFAYELLRNLLPKRESHIDIAQTCLRYLSLKPLRGGPCTSAAEMIKRVDSLPFLEYSSKYWGQHIISGDCEKELDLLILELLDDTRLSDSAFQALQFRREYASTGTAEELFQSLPINSHALHLAAYWGFTQITGKILEAGAPPSPVDSHKWTPLHWACANNRLGVAEILLSRGADVNAQDNQGWSPLFWSAFVGSNLMVHLLLRNGADHLARSTLGWTALHWAISGGHTELAKKLLDHHSESQSSKPLFHGMTMKEIESYTNATSLVDVVAGDQDYDIFTALTDHLQTSRGTITDAGFNEIWKRESFDVPVSFNLWRTMTKSERINGRDYGSVSIRRNANSLEKRESGDNDWKSSLLISAIRDQQLSSVELLVKAGADMDNNRALFMAARRQDPRYVQCLLENGANPNVIDHYGRTPLHEAVMDGFVENVSALLDGGADVNKPVARDPDSISVGEVDIEMADYSITCNDIGSTALIQTSGFAQTGHYGAERFQTQSSGFELITEITQLLLSKGADPGLKDPSGRTALHYAMLRPHLPWVKLLIDAGCPVDAVDCNGSMPLHLLAARQEKTVLTGMI